MNKKKIIIILCVILALSVFLVLKFKGREKAEEVLTEISPIVGSIQVTISTTGTVLPKNRLELKPPVGGRIESILVKEGEHVSKGQVLAWMSSTERAALLDAAQGQGEEQVKYWQTAYKPIALLAPIDGEVIVATTQPGQTVTTADAVIVLSDHLIVRAQIDETDIGKIKLNQNATVILDAYPDTKISATVDHIYYESETVNNVTIYKADLICKEVPDFFRSGMNATVNFLVKGNDKMLIIPLEAVRREKNEDYVLVSNGRGEPEKRVVLLGMSDDKTTEIISGISATDKIIEKPRKAAAAKNSGGGNPFMPFGNRKAQPPKK